MQAHLRKNIHKIEYLIGQNQHSAARALLQTLLFNYPHVVILRKLAAQLAYAEGDLAQACTHLTIALQQAPLTLELIHQYLWILCLLERFEEVITYLRIYPLEFYQHAESYFLLGYAYQQIQDYQQAVQHYQQCLVYQDDHRRCLFYYGQLAAQQKDYHQSCHLLKTLCRQDTQSAENLYLYAQSLIHINEYSLGIKSFKKALKLHKYHTWIHYDLAHVYFEQKQFKKAKKHYHLALTYQPIQYQAYYRLSQMAILQRDYQQAITHLQHYLPHAKNKSEIQQSIHSLQNEITLS